MSGISFKIAYQCDTCKRSLAVMGDFNNIEKIGRIQIPINNIRCTNCHNDSRSMIILIGPDQPEYDLAVPGTIRLLDGGMICGKQTHPLYSPKSHQDE